MMEKIWRAIQTGLAAAGGLCALFWGGLDNLLIALIVFAAVDYATGVLAAILEKKLDSRIGFKGIAKKVLMFLIVGIANIIDVRLIQTGSGFRTATIIFYIANEGVSLLENATRCGLPVPKKLKDILTQLHEKAEEEDKKKMIIINGKAYRNLEEAVYYLDFMIKQATDVVKNVYGIEATVADLPPASTFSNGTTYAVGATAPYDYYVAIDGSWIALGTFPVPGPAGRDGSDGSDGSDGRDGNSIFITSQATTSSTTSIITSSIYNPNSLPIIAGNLVLSEQGDIFEITQWHAPACDVLWRCNIIGPTGPTGPNGKGIYYSTASTTSSTTVIAGSTVYNPDGRTIGAGDVILSATGDIFTITGISGSAALVTYRENLIGATGATGKGIYYSTASTTSSTTAISTLTVYNPDNRTIDSGDIILTSTGDIFTISGISGVFYNVTYRVNIVGATGSIFYSGSDLTYDPLGLQVEVSLSDVPDIRVDDYYLVTSDYQSDGHDFYKGDVFVCTSVGVSTADLSYVCNIRGPQGSAGSPGADGATIFYGGDIYHTGGSGGAYLIDKATIPTMKVGDYYLVNATYTSDGETITDGTLWYALTDTGTSFYMTIVTSLVGPPADLVWGNITGTLADQDDLNTKFGTYLLKSGGTMTGAITTTQSTIIRRSSSAAILAQTSSSITLGRTALTELTLTTAEATNIKHSRNGTTYPMLDTYNTKANDGYGTTVLKELTLNSTKYGVTHIAGGYTISISGARGAYNLRVLGFINNEFGMHQIEKADNGFVYIDGVDSGDTSITMTNASILIPVGISLENITGGTGSAYDSMGSSITAIMLPNNLNKILWMASDLSITYA